MRRRAHERREAAALAQPAPEVARANAEKATAGAGERLPHGDVLQRAFGRHDLSGVRAQTGAPRSVALGERVGFAGAPDLRTSAHEAAHVVQQRRGAGAGAALERHADAVADRVVQGHGVEALLDRAGSSSGASQPVAQHYQLTVHDVGSKFRVPTPQGVQELTLVSFADERGEFALPSGATISIHQDRVLGPAGAAAAAAGGAGGVAHMDDGGSGDEAGGDSGDDAAEPALVRTASVATASRRETRNADKATRRYFDPKRLRPEARQDIDDHLAAPSAASMRDRKATASVDFTGRSTRESVIAERLAVDRASGPAPVRSGAMFGEMPRDQKGGQVAERYGDTDVFRRLNPGPGGNLNLFVASGGSYSPSAPSSMERRLEAHTRAQPGGEEADARERERRGSQTLGTHLATGSAIAGDGAAARNVTRAGGVLRAEVLRGVEDPTAKPYAADVSDVLALSSSSAPARARPLSATGPYATFQREGASTEPAAQEPARAALRRDRTEQTATGLGMGAAPDGQQHYRTTEQFHRQFQSTFGGAALSPGRPYSDSDTPPSSPKGADSAHDGHAAPASAAPASHGAGGGAAAAAPAPLVPAYDQSVGAWYGTLSATDRHRVDAVLAAHHWRLAPDGSVVDASEAAVDDGTVAAALASG